MNLNASSSMFQKNWKKLGFVYLDFKIKDLNFLDYEFVCENKVK